MNKANVFYLCPLLIYFLLESNIIYEYLGCYFIYLFWLIYCFIASLVRFPQISGQTSSMRKGINFGQSRARAQFLRKISEVSLGNIPIPSKK